jgi:hypothetical protein
VADPRRHLQSPELHRLVDQHVELDDAAGDLVEPRKDCDGIVQGRGTGGRDRCPQHKYNQATLEIHAHHGVQGS